MLDIKTLQELIDREFTQPAQSSPGSLTRISELTRRGIHTPASLNMDEVQQISFALSILLSEEKL